jgi:glycosyltransferase involved in cell wall biosynthesis
MGVEAQPPQPPADAVAGFRQRYGALGPLVAFLGANTYDKGAFTLANAVAFLNAEGAGVSLICAGPQAHELQAYLRGQPAAVQAALRGRVHLLGVVSEPVKALLLEACTVLALPSRVDTFGIVILEAWARAKPVVGAAAGGIPDLIEAGQTGLLVPFGDVEALAGAIGRLVSGRDLAQRLGAAGQQVVQRRYTWDNTFDVLIAAFDKICTRRIS